MAVSGEDSNTMIFTASGDVTTRTFIMDSLRWVGGASAGDQLVVQDGDGNEIFKSLANGSNFIDGWVWSRKYMGGLSVNKMTSGTLYVYRLQG